MGPEGLSAGQGTGGVGRKARRWALAMALLLWAGCGNNPPAGGGGGGNPPDFTLTLNPSSLTVTQGGSATTQLTLTPKNGFTGTVSLALEGAPQGVTLSPNSLTVSGSNPVTLTLTLTTSSSTPTRTYSLTLKATSGNLSRSVPLTLTVNPVGGMGGIVYIKASNTSAGSLFGWSVALSADGNTLAVGAPGERYSSGAVYVFTRNGGTWVQEAYIKASNAEVNDYFGWSVALSADGNTLAVGAPQEDSRATGVNGDQGDNSAQDSGAVYVFTRSGGTWVQEAYIKASNTEEGDRFGYSLALSADGSTLAVGAPYEDSGATGVNGNQGDNSAIWAGAVYVFTRSGGTWVQEAYIKASNAGAGDWFGLDLTLSADGSTLAVGAPQEDSHSTGVNGNEWDNSATNSGAVYVFTRSGSTWVQEAYIKASNAEEWDQFGLNVALSAEGNTLAVGAPGEASGATGVNGNQGDNSARYSGAVYVFTRSGGTWVQEAYIKASNTETSDAFGARLALSADGNTLAVGAPQEDSRATGVNGDQGDNSAQDSGAVYVFTRSGGTWAQQAYVKASNTGSGDSFGSDVALSTGGSTLAVGAFHEDSSATGVNGNQLDNTAPESGAAYVYSLY